MSKNITSKSEITEERIQLIEDAINRLDRSGECTLDVQSVERLIELEKLRQLKRIADILSEHWEITE